MLREAPDTVRPRGTKPRARQNWGRLRRHDAGVGNAPNAPKNSINISFSPRWLAGKPRASRPHTREALHKSKRRWLRRAESSESEPGGQGVRRSPEFID